MMTLKVAILLEWNRIFVPRGTRGSFYVSWLSTVVSLCAIYLLYIPVCQFDEFFMIGSETFVILINCATTT